MLERVAPLSMERNSTEVPNRKGTKRLTNEVAVFLVCLTAAAAAPADGGYTKEWTAERAAKEWMPMSRAVEHVGVPGYEWQAGVLWDGSLFFGPEDPNSAAMKAETAIFSNSPLHVSVGYGMPAHFLDRRGLGSTALSQSLDQGRLPVPHVEARDGGLIWSETVFAQLLGRDPQSGIEPYDSDVLVVQAGFEVRNPTNAPRQAHLWLHFGDTSQVDLGYKMWEGVDLAPAIGHRFEAPFGFLGDKVRYVIPKPAQGQIAWHETERVEGQPRPASRLIEWTVRLSPGKRSFFRLLVPYGLVDRATAQQIASLSYEPALEQTRRFWESVETQAGAITTPDAFLNDYLAAVAGNMAEQVAYRHKAGLWMYKTSPNHYESYWPCNAAKALPTFDLRGLSRYSLPVLKSFVDTQTADFGQLTRELSGKAVSGEGFERHPGFLGNFRDWTANTLLLSHGLEMWALASHFRITRNREWLGNGPGSVLQALLEACNWLSVQRRRTMRTENGRKVPHWGLLPAASAHDWLSGNTIFNDAFCIYGMTETVRLLREIHHSRAEELARELNDYRACLRERYVEARDRARPVPLPDGSQLPYIPRDVYELDWAKPDWTYTGYGPVRAGAWGALDPNDELVNQSLAFLEAGMPKGEGYYFRLAGTRSCDPTADRNFADVNEPGEPRHYLWRHYVEYETMWPIGYDLFLQRDDLPRFFEWFFNTMAVVVHRGFRVGVESLDGVPSCAPGDAERWRAVRDMFVNERGGYDGSQQSLWLMQAIPRSWLKPGSRLGVKEMGTAFGGRVNLEEQVAPDGQSVVVRADLHLKEIPTGIRMRLRSPDGRPLAAATIDGRAAQILTGDTIQLPLRSEGSYRIVGRF